MILGPQKLDNFETPVTVTPQQKISKTLNSSKNSLKILSVYFWGDSVYFWGVNVYFGETTLTFGEIRDSRRFLGFWNFSFFCCSGGFGGSVGRGAHRGSEDNRDSSWSGQESQLQPQMFTRFFRVLQKEVGKERVRSFVSCFGERLRGNRKRGNRTESL